MLCFVVKWIFNNLKTIWIKKISKKDWDSRGYSFGIFKDPPGKIWADYVHMTDELVVLAEGEIEIEIEGKSEQPTIGREIFIPANAMHTVRNVGNTNNVWYYGYKR
jgi:mannose-6-phosphate isomerase-like protein (cupin superfamily)